MKSPQSTPEELLFTDLEGDRVSFQDVVDEGLDGGYESRIPALIELLDSENPYYRLLSSVMLTSWGEAEGFQKLVEWAKNPEVTPWAEAPVVFERYTGADSAFEMIADGLRTSYYCEDEAQLTEWQVAATKALLAIYHKYYFGQTLALAIVKSKKRAIKVYNEIIAAIEASFNQLNEEQTTQFDLAFQVASLHMPLVDLDDKAAALYASRLILKFPDNIRMLKELIGALASGKGDDTLKVIKDLEAKQISGIEQELENALKRRGVQA